MTGRWTEHILDAGRAGGDLLTRAGLVLCLVGAAPLPVQAQTTTTGALSGVVQDESGMAVEGVEVTLLREGGTSQRIVSANRSGRFTAAFLSPGRYEAVVERFGYVPVRVEDVVIRSARTSSLRVQLREASPPVTEVDRVSFSAVGREEGGMGSRMLTRRELDAVPTRGRELSGLLSRWSLAGGDFGSAGLPGDLTTLRVDGLPHDPAADPRTGPGFLHGLAFPPAFLADVEFLPRAVDAEVGEGAGGVLRATTVRGGNEMQVEGFGNAAGAPLGADGLFGTEVPSSYGPDVGVLVRGPLRHDTAHFAVGAVARRAVRPVAPLALSSLQGGRDFLEAIGEGGESSPTGLGATRAGEWQVLSTFGRLDWRLGESSSLALRSSVGLARSDDEVPALAVPVTPHEARNRTDAELAAEFLTPMGERGAFELRAGFGSSSLESAQGDAALPFTWIQEGGVVAGRAPGTVHDVQQRSLYVSPVAHAELGLHRIKLGVALSAHRYEEDAVPGWSTGFAFSDLDAFGQGRGLGVQLTGREHAVSFDHTRVAVFAQDRWTPAAGLALTAAVRLERETLPFEDILPSEGWASRTGMDRTAVQGPGSSVSPRLGLEWVPDDEATWRFEASTGLYQGTVNRHLMAEVLADSGAVRVRRSLDDAASWPQPGVDDAASVEGAALSLFGPTFDAPRTLASHGAIRRRLSGSTELEVEFGHRRTEFLPRRRDLNRTPLPWGTDQFGRSLFGRVSDEGGIVAVVPGSDRRFTGYDVVSALESDGWSEWWGLTVGLSHAAADRLELAARYTFSDTQDNLPGFAQGWTAMVPGRPDADGRDPEWVEGRSDLDVPHRLVVDGTLTLMERPGLRVGALYVLRSGRPFTPGVRDLLDGTAPLQWRSTRPVSLPSGAMSELSELTTTWSCLRELGGAALERNVCRTDPSHELNVRLTMSLMDGPGWRVELVADGLNILDSGPVLPDPAVFVVDGGGTVMEQEDGSIQLPVKVNPGFGEPLVRLSAGRALRIGVGVRY